MMELFVRRINLQLIERTFTPMKHETAASRRGFINEIAFEMFAADEDRVKTADGLNASISNARVLMERIKDARDTDLSDPTSEEMEDVREQVRRLHLFFRIVADGETVEKKPKFAGCGIIDACEGDVYLKEQLFEIKAGDRQVRSVDLRQLLVYAALNYAEQGRKIQRLGLFNPRVGTHFSATLEEICLEVSGRPSRETLAEIVRVFSSGDISR